MRDVKVVAYGSVSEDDERLIENYLNDKMERVQIYSVDTPLELANKVIADKNARIAELEKLIDDRPTD